MERKERAALPMRTQTSEREPARALHKHHVQPPC